MGIYVKFKHLSDMPEFELRFRLHCDISASKRGEWELLQSEMKRAFNPGLFLLWVKHLRQNKVGNAADLQEHPCLEGGIGSQRVLRNVTRRLTTAKNCDFSEILLRAEDDCAQSSYWTERHVRRFGLAFCSALGEYLSVEDAIDFYVVLDEVLSSDEESSHYEESDGEVAAECNFFLVGNT